jgi:2,3-bisphosphoglycerate-independent phosphoglycerate mutase
MSAVSLTDQVLAKIAAGQYDFILINYANADMVGHTGNIEAVKQAVQAVDTCLGRVLDAVLAKQGAVLVTADHGNAEMLRDPITGEVEKEHSSNPVPFALVAAGFERTNYLPSGVELGFQPGVPAGVLTDVAPTVLELLGLERPSFMTGRSLII